MGGEQLHPLPAAKEESEEMEESSAPKVEHEEHPELEKEEFHMTVSLQHQQEEDSASKLISLGEEQD
eukprot:3436410-Ditylum_brightwellii.AAC.1